MVFSGSISTIPRQRTGPRRSSGLSCTFRAELASNCAAGDGFTPTKTHARSGAVPDFRQRSEGSTKRLLAMPEGRDKGSGFLLLFRGLAPSGPIHQEQTFIVHQSNSRLQRKIAQALRKTEDDTGPIFVLSKYYVRQEIRIARNWGQV